MWRVLGHALVHLAVTWRLPGGYRAVTWRLQGGYDRVWVGHGLDTDRARVGHMAVTWRLPGGYLAVTWRHVVATSRP